MVEVQFVLAEEVELVGAALEPVHRFVERVVAGVRRHVDELEIGLLEGRQDAGHDHVAAAGLGRLPRLAEQLAELPLHIAQTAAAEDVGVEVELEVEAGEFGREVRVLDGLEDLGGDRRRAPVGVDQKELLLGTDASHAGLEPLLLEHFFEGLNVLQEVAEKNPDLFGL